MNPEVDAAHRRRIDRHVRQRRARADDLDVLRAARDRYGACESLCKLINAVGADGVTARAAHRGHCDGRLGLRYVVRHSQGVIVAAFGHGERHRFIVEVILFERDGFCGVIDGNAVGVCNAAEQEQLIALDIMEVRSDGFKR